MVVYCINGSCTSCILPCHYVAELPTLVASSFSARRAPPWFCRMCYLERPTLRRTDAASSIRQRFASLPKANSRVNSGKGIQHPKLLEK